MTVDPYEVGLAVGGVAALLALNAVMHAVDRATHRFRPGHPTGPRPGGASPARRGR